jgi:acetyl esterase/lipase
MRHCVPLVLAILASVCGVAQEPLAMRLWPEGPPGVMQEPSPETRELVDRRISKPGFISYIAQPEMIVYPAVKPNGACVVVAPGGGFGFLSFENEGAKVCKWLNRIGVTGVLLKYRTPTRDEAHSFRKPVDDARRALGLVRHHAEEWGVDPKRVGVLGFSAGGNLVGHLCCDRGAATYPLNPEFDDERGPDFGIMISAGGFSDRQDPYRMKEGFSVPEDAPPMFLLVAQDDKNCAIDAALIYLEYKRRGLPAELHIYAQGRHEFGMRREGKPINEWRQRCSEWMGALGFLGAR